ncbi:Dosage compensation protein dpy-30 [Trichostrongylus colubriformis]|uniref:Dosage compensation protein dpy-30 n=1 Tax=Trichostrongylus colubriformis TaxID=6319 RepID=A0AAN8J3L2_TRICO
MLQLLDSLNSSALERMSSGSIGAHRLGMADVATEAAPAPAETPAAPAESAPAPAPAPAPAESMETGEAPPPATAPNSAEENAPAAPAAAPAAPASAPAAQPAPAAATDAPKSTGVLAPPRAAPAIPTRQYLDQTVVPILLQALGALAKERPENPIDFLINFLIKEKERYQPSTENVS